MNISFQNLLLSWVSFFRNINSEQANEIAHVMQALNTSQSNSSTSQICKLLTCLKIDYSADPHIQESTWSSGVCFKHSDLRLMMQ